MNYCRVLLSAHPHIQAKVLAQGCKCHALAKSDYFWLYAKKVPILPLFINGEIYAKDVIVRITFYATGSVVKSCELPWPPLQKLLLYKEKIL